MSNSRFNIKTEDPGNTSRTFGKMSLNVYKPGFIDTVSTEAMKMAIDRELGEISKALFQTAENTSKEIEDAVGDIDFAEIKEEIVKLEVKVGENSAAITDEARVRADQDGALGERISNVKAESDAGIAQVTQTTTALSNSVGKLEAKWGVQVNVNNKIAGIALNNDGASSSFEVIADRFSISDGTNNTGAPFEVVNGQTKIKNASVGTIHSDNWNGSTTGWAITKDGFASFNNVTVRGHVEASSGTFSGSLQVSDQGGNVGMKITNQQILVYDDAGRLRVRIGRLT